MFNVHSASLEHFVRSLAEQEEQGALIHPHSTGILGVQEFDFTIVVNPELQSL